MSEQHVDLDPSPGVPDVHPPTVTVSRDCAGFAWLSLLKVGDDLLPPAERTKAKQELYAALWPDLRRCRICGCTEDNCGNCVERTGQPCYWIEPDLCSACSAQR